MQQLLSVWSALEPRRRIIVVLATLAMFAAVLAVTRLATTPSMTLLYGGLENGAAGEIVRALDQRGARYEVRGNSIFVETGQRDELRMTLASEGLPANSVAGYELLDSLSGFGTTSQMFDAAYWRAKEGELARTITASPHISAARVHIATPPSQPFKARVKPTASVTVTPTSGALSAPHGKALRFLVASAVAGLSPEDVSIIDSQNGLISGAEEVATGADATDRAQSLKQSVERLLEARVGYGNAIVEVSVETVTERESVFERVFDPSSRVAISTDSEERSMAAEDSDSGAVSVASNLPAGDAGAGEGSSSSTNTETRERVNFEVSETSREILREPGAVKRLTVAVLVDGLTTTDADGAEVFTPRAEEELTALRELVASAVGYDEGRGDVITIKSLAFEPIAELGTAAAPGLLDQLDLMLIVQLLALVIVVAVLAIFVLRPILAAKAPLPGNPEQPALPPLAPPPDIARSAPEPGLTGEIADDSFAPPPMATMPEFDLTQGPADLPQIAALPGDQSAADPVTRLRQLIEERQDETVEILRSWMDEREGTA